jgi:predicted NUDIX family NTP pyrophosphohydrolase
MIMAKQSAGILVFRKKNNRLEVFLVHPGGPFWIKKDLGAWSIPKGEIEEGEDPMNVAIREFNEETGQEMNGEFMALQAVKQKGGKTVIAWAIEGEVNEEKIISNTFEIEWPPKSGKMKSFPEIDKAEWFSIPAAKEKINPAQINFIDELTTILKDREE